MYPELMVIPMREELVRAGIVETRTAEDVDAALAQPGTTMLVVNSICGCAAGKMRPGVRLALGNSANLPDYRITVFAGQDREATERAHIPRDRTSPRREAGLPDAALRYRAVHRAADCRRARSGLRRVLRKDNGIEQSQTFRIGPGYWAITVSAVNKVIPSTMAWAIRMRSKGSL